MKTLSDLLMTLTTPLGPASQSTLMLQSLSATEELGRMFSIDIQALSSKPDHDPLALLGKTVSVALETQQGEMRHLHGHVAAFGLTGLSGGFFQYRMTVQPWTTFLSRRSNCRIFQNIGVKDILKKIFDDYPDSPQYRFELSLTHPAWEYCVQYRETDFNFVQRLMEQQGIYYYFEHTESSHTMVIVDSVDKHKPCSDGYDEVPFVLPGSSGSGVDIEYIDHWNISNSIRAEKMAFRHFDFKRAKLTLESELSNPVVKHGGEKEYFDFPGSHLQVGDAGQIARVRLEELQAQQLRITGSGTARGLKCGHKMKLTDHPRKDQNAEFLLLSTHLMCQLSAHEAGQGGMTTVLCNFTAAPAATPFRPARNTPKVHVQGPQTAMVVGPSGEEIHCDEHGRVKVQFHWDRDTERAPEDKSCWVRVSHPWAGKGWGAISIPRIGQEVIVDFLEGDPDQPIITGRVYNSEQPVPFALPAKKTISGIKSNTHKGEGYNEFTMDDTAGNELINTHAQYNMTTVVEHDDTQTVHNNRTIKVDGTHTETITKDTKITIESGTYNHDVAGNTATYHVSADLTENYDAKQSTTVGADQTNTLGANRTTSVATNDNLSVGSNQEVSVGANLTVAAGANADYTVGAAHTLTVSSTSETKAGTKLVLTVGASTIEMTPAGIKLSCGASSIELTPASVAVTAPMISLNG